jgi:hypothetical protein
VFSWFIYRLTTPALRNLFLRPSNVFRLQEAMLAMLAGDIFRGTPLGVRLFAFKAIYYLNSLLTLKASLMAWNRRKHSIRAVETEAIAANQES